MTHVQFLDADWLARTADAVVDGAITITIIIAVAFALRWVVHRTVSRVARQSRAGSDPHLSERRRQRIATIASLLRSIASFVILGVAFVMVLAEVGVDIAPILTSVGVLGLAIGFGAQNLVRDFLSGIFMMLEDQYGVGDNVDLGEAVGDVEAVGLRTTTVRDINGTVWYVRNGEILRVGNFSQGYAVALVDVPIAHHADTTRAMVVAEQAAQDVASGPRSVDVTGEPEMLGVQSVTPYAVTLRVTVRTRPGRQFAVQRALNAGIQSALTAQRVPAPTVPGLPVTAG